MFVQCNYQVSNRMSSPNKGSFDITNIDGTYSLCAMFCFMSNIHSQGGGSFFSVYLKIMKTGKGQEKKSKVENTCAFYYIIILYINEL